MLHIFKNKVVTAAKEHICDDCNKTIRSKQKYRYFAGIREGSFFTYRSCAECSEKLDNLPCN